MPKKKDIHSVLIIGSGPIIIGQACEFDYSGTQACKALKKLGYKVILVNSNPATIMTDPGIADVTYIEPLNVKTLAEIIKKEKPDALLPNLGGQSALNLSTALHTEGILKQYGVRIIGVDIDAIGRGEDRTQFKQMMAELKIDVPKSEAVFSVEDAEGVAAQLGYPVVIRPAYTMGGTGGGLVYNAEDLRIIANRGLEASLIHQILVEESVLGWEELELEIVRDAHSNKITVCFIENVDAIGVHTGDSFCTAPMLTISQELQDKLRAYSYAIVDAIKVIGGTNVQFAHNPKTGRVVAIEINPRTSRSSALASKATGFPIALISAQLAAGITLDEIPYWRDGTLDKYTPSGDYVVVKFARWAFEKFKDAKDELGTQMRAVGEVMSIGKTYKEAFQKAVRSLERGRYGLGFAGGFHEKTLEELMSMLQYPSSERHFIMYEALRKGASTEDLYALTFIKPYFIEQMRELIQLEEKILSCINGNISDELLINAKKDGFSDRYLSMLTKKPEKEIRARRILLGIVHAYEAVPVSGAENASYFYSTYSGSDSVEVSSNRKIMILGGGPNRIGQGIEFDYCCVHAAFALRDAGYETIMVNCNPETVSTDYDTSDKLYFEPLTVEDVLSIYEKEKPLGVIVQFGGQTPLNLAQELTECGVPILGTVPDSIDLAEDRDRFRLMMSTAGIPMPQSGMASSSEEALKIAAEIGYPCMVRPSYVLGGSGMEIVYDKDMLAYYIKRAAEITGDRPILIDRFLENALECEADALSDGTDVFVPAIMEHIEQAGIHSGDSACVIPPISITADQKKTINEYTERIARQLKVVGLMNMQYAIHDNTVYVLEANPRASRTVPIVSKVCGINMAKCATEIMIGKKLAELKLTPPVFAHFGVKESVFPFNMFPEVDPVLGPEMRSTGEVLGLASSFGLAFYKSQEAVQSPPPLEGNVLISVTLAEHKAVLPIAVQFAQLGFKIFATEGTCKFLNSNGVRAELVKKLHEGRPHIVDKILNKEIHLIINTPIGKLGQFDDSYIRKAAVKYKIPYMTTTAAANACVKGIFERRKHSITVKSIQQ